MGDPTRQTVCVYDLAGSYTHVSEALVGQFKEVLYFNQYQTAFPSAAHYMPGVGLDGIDRVDDFFEALDRIDIVVFPDVGHVGLQKYLRSTGHAVFGSGEGARLEQDRSLLKTVIQKAGLDLAPFAIVHGIDDLRELLKKSDDLYIKFSVFRGDLETFHHMNYFTTQTWLDDVSARLGPYGQIADFIIEQPIEDEDLGIPTVEVGLDGFCIDGEMLMPSLWGYEVKDAAYLGNAGAVPERLLAVSEALRPLLKSIQYRGPLSTEVRFTKDKAYLIDFTARFPSPPSEVMTLMLDNLGEIISEGAEGRIVEPQFKAVYGAQLILRSEWVRDHYLGLKLDDPEHVRIHGHCRIEDQDYAVSPAEIREFGAAVGRGDTLESAIAQACEAAESVHAYQYEYDGSGFGKAMDCIMQGKKLDLPWGGVPEGGLRLAEATS